MYAPEVSDQLPRGCLHVRDFLDGDAGEDFRLGNIGCNDARALQQFTGYILHATGIEQFCVALAESRPRLRAA